jgi:anti-sigma factor ChrR (cupin superfamily)
VSTSEKSIQFLECLPRGEWLNMKALRKCASAVLINPDHVLRLVSVLQRQQLLEWRWNEVQGRKEWRVREDFAEVEP